MPGDVCCHACGPHAINKPALQLSSASPMYSQALCRQPQTVDHLKFRTGCLRVASTEVPPKSPRAGIWNSEKRKSRIQRELPAGTNLCQDKLHFIVLFILFSFLLLCYYFFVFFLPYLLFLFPFLTLFFALFPLLNSFLFLLFSSLVSFIHFTFFIFICSLPCLHSYFFLCPFLHFVFFFIFIFILALFSLS